MTKFYVLYDHFCLYDIYYQTINRNRKVIGLLVMPWPCANLNAVFRFSDITKLTIHYFPPYEHIFFGQQ